MKYIMLSIIISVICSCSGPRLQTDDDMTQGQLAEETQKVSLSVARTAPFYNEIVSNGKAVAHRYADVYWNVDGTVEAVYTSNGSYIEAGSHIARLADFRLNNSLESARATLENAKLQMYEIIIGQGFSPDSTEVIPQSVRELAEVKSGYLQSLASYRSAEYDMQHSAAVAPISGVVANLATRPSNKANRSQALCRIIDNRSMCIEFPVIESEIWMLKRDAVVEVEAFAMPGRKWKGRIAEVNPRVESNGMVKVIAAIEDASDIFEGMNLSVKVRREAGHFLAVPKSAVVTRSNRPVVFVAQNGRAQWCYVETSLTNSEMTAVLTGINEGDSVIVTGNEFLAHNSRIVVK